MGHWNLILASGTTTALSSIGFRLVSACRPKVFTRGRLLSVSMIREKNIARQLSSAILLARAVPTFLEAGYEAQNLGKMALEADTPVCENNDQSYDDRDQSE